jgi:hypothetical protein
VKRIASIFVLACLCFAKSAAYAQHSEAPAAEQELLKYANEARQRAGAPPLAWNQWLAQAARKHAQMMVDRGQLSHEFPGEPPLLQRVIDSGIRFDSSAENVALGETPSEIHQGWMESPGHRTNLLNPKYNAVGIVVMRRGIVLYAVQDFAHTVPELTATDVENAVAEGIDHLRQKDHQPRMQRLEIPQLRRVACDMAHRDQVQGAAVFGVADNLKAGIAFTEADPRKFEAQLLKSKTSWPYTKYAVGACFAKTPTYPEGTNFVLVGFF